MWNYCKLSGVYWTLSQLVSFCQKKIDNVIVGWWRNDCIGVICHMSHPSWCVDRFQIQLHRVSLGYKIGAVCYFFLQEPFLKCRFRASLRLKLLPHPPIHIPPLLRTRLHRLSESFRKCVLTCLCKSCMRSFVWRYGQIGQSFCPLESRARMGPASAPVAWIFRDAESRVRVSERFRDAESRIRVSERLRGWEDGNVCSAAWAFCLWRRFSTQNVGGADPYLGEVSWYIPAAIALWLASNPKALSSWSL